MNPQYRLLYIVAIALIAGVSEAEYDAGAPENIIGGIPANVGEFPYIVSLNVNGAHFCGGVIVDARHVLTAAHCVETLSFPYNTAVIETGSIFNDDGEIHSIERITSHVQYNKSIVSSSYDIAIIVLKKNIIFNDNQTSVALPDGPPPSGVNATIAGWGTTNASVRLHSPYLMKMNITILDYENCLGKVPNKNDIHKDYQICASSPVGIGSCYGDSGGTLVYNGTLIGIDSFGYGCGEGYPEVYANVSHFIPWIQEQIAETYRTEGKSNLSHIVATHFENILKTASALEGLNPLIIYKQTYDMLSYVASLAQSIFCL